jgi:glutaconate CoA-transferase, subunit B
MMAAVAAQELRDGEVVFVGIGLPNLASNLARATHAPNLMLVYESGAIGARPQRSPLSIGDPALAAGALMVCGMADVFQLLLQRGRIDVGFLGGAQVDRYGNINTTVIGDYAGPHIRLPGSGGAAEIAAHARRTLVVGRLERRSFPEHVDFVTSPGHRWRGRRRAEFDMAGAGPVQVITDKCVLECDEDGELALASLYPGVEVEDVRRDVGWTLRVREPLRRATLPDDAVLRFLRERA